MSRLIDILDRDGLVTSYCACANPDCYEVVRSIAQNRLIRGQWIEVSETEAGDNDTCDNAGTWQQIKTDKRIRRLHYLDSDVLALSGKDLESIL